MCPDMSWYSDVNAIIIAFTSNPGDLLGSRRTHRASDDPDRPAQKSRFRTPVRGRGFHTLPGRQAAYTRIYRIAYRQALVCGINSQEFDTPQGRMTATRGTEGRAVDRPRRSSQSRHCSRPRGPEFR